MWLFIEFHPHIYTHPIPDQPTLQSRGALFILYFTKKLTRIQWFTITSIYYFNFKFDNAIEFCKFSMFLLWRPSRCCIKMQHNFFIFWFYFQRKWTAMSSVLLAAVYTAVSEHCLHMLCTGSSTGTDQYCYFYCKNDNFKTLRSIKKMKIRFLKMFATVNCIRKLYTKHSDVIRCK